MKARQEAAKSEASIVGEFAHASALQARKPLLWINPKRRPGDRYDIDGEPFRAAEDRLLRARPLIRLLFPDSEVDRLGVESPLLAVPQLQKAFGMASPGGALLLKADHRLPVAGSIKARGGFHEVLAHAEGLAVAAGLLAPGGDLAALASPEARELFRDRRIAVGSTGNLGLSIGSLAAAMGFQAVVHMSSDAKLWKKQALRSRGATVVEHAGDYLQAVAAGRLAAARDPLTYFVDDENSTLLLEGYAAAAGPLADQLSALGRTPSHEQPLFVYLPCGVGGAPGGIALGLTRLFGQHVHCFFAEPVASPCMLLALATDCEGAVSVYDHGLDNRTDADGLAVPRASELVASRIDRIVAGIFTVSDDELYAGLLALWETEGLEIEPSAAAGFCGPRWLLDSAGGQEYLETFGLAQRLPAATHVLWSTGGLLVPAEDHASFRRIARARAAAR